MTVRHVVLFEFNDDVTEAQIDGLLAALAGLADEIDFLTNVSAGRDLSGRSVYGAGFQCDVPSADDLPTYGRHPAHVAAVEAHVKPLCKSWSVVDYEV